MTDQEIDALVEDHLPPWAVCRAREGTPMPTIEGAIQTFKMVQLIS